MILRLLLVLALLPCPHLNAMVGSTSSAAPVHMANGTCLAHRAVSTHPISGKPKSSNTEALKDTHISIRERYKQEVAETLDYAARVPATEEVDLVGYLLTKIDPAYIKDPESLLVAALENNHPVLFKYVEKTFGAECTEKAVRDAIREGQQANVEKLLDESVHMKSVRPLLVPTAIRALSDIDDATTTAQRLAILKTVLNRAEVKDVPTVLDLDLRTIPLHVQDKLKRLLNERLYPPRLCMSENAGDTPLHRAAAAGDREAAEAYLTKSHAPFTKEEMALANDLETAKQVDKPFTGDIVRAFERFLYNQHVLAPRIQQQKQIAQKQRLARNCRGLTAYEVAVATFGEPNSARLRSQEIMDYFRLQNLLRILDPGEDIIYGEKILLRK